MSEPPPNSLGTRYGVTYGRPFIDIDEDRQHPRPHRYVHGGFEGSHLLFSVYLPPRDLYKKRFLLLMEGGPGGMEKLLSSRSLAALGADSMFDLAFDDLGAYLVETNEGHYPDEGMGTDNPRVIWQASSYATDYARAIAQRYYGAAPQRGYLTGCSGGGMRSASSLENAPQLFDGGVSQAWGHDSMSEWSAYGLAGALLGDKLDQVKDAAEVGGGDMYAGLTVQQAEALRIFIAIGFPRQAMFQASLGTPSMPHMLYTAFASDPAYFKDFWVKQGYVGHDEPGLIKPLLVDEEMTVEQVYSTAEAAKAGWIRMMAPAAPSADGKEAHPAGRLSWKGDSNKLFMSRITILSGDDKGKSMYVSGVRPGGVVQPFLLQAPWGFNNVKAGDRVRVDNRDWLAFIYYHRYSASPEWAALKQPGHSLLWPQHRMFENPDGTARYVQRSTPGAPGITTGKLNPRSKLITIGGMADEPIWPASLEVYGQMVRAHLGTRTDNSFRQWFMERLPHCSGPLTGPLSTRTVPASGMTAEAIRQMVRWVEEGKPPLASTSYSFAPSSNELTLAPTAQARRGIQPVVTLKANGGTRADVKVGEPVRFDASAIVPPGAGTIVRAQFDFDGQGTWPLAIPADGRSDRISAAPVHKFDKPGTYFVTFRVGSAGPGRAAKEAYPIYNLARARVVVR